MSREPRSRLDLRNVRHRGRQVFTGALAIIAGLALVACGKSSTVAPGKSTTSLSSTPTVTAAAATTTSTLEAGPQGVSPPTETGLQPCLTNQLWIHPTGGSDAAMSIGLHITFTNTSSGACTLTGYPIVQLVAPSGKVAGSPTQLANGGYLPNGFSGNPDQLPVIQLDTGQSASALLQGNEEGNPSRCATFDWLRIGAPKSSEMVTISAAVPDEGTNLPGCGDPILGPLIPGANTSSG